MAQVTVEEVNDEDEPLSYAEGTPQPLKESAVVPGHYQIEFPGEQILGKTNSDVSEIEEIKPLPRDTRPSGFAMPPLTPHQTTLPPPPPHRYVPTFSEPTLRRWLLSYQKRQELIVELHTTNPSIATQLEDYIKMKRAIENCEIIEDDMHESKKDVEEEAKKTTQKIERLEDSLREL